MNIKHPTSEDCGPIAPLVDDLIDGHIDEGARLTVQAHLSTCDACRRLVDDLNELRQQAGSLAPHTPRPEVWARIARGLQAQAPAPSPQRTFWTGTRVALAMAAVVILSVVSSVVILRGPQTGGLAGTSAQPTTGAVHVSATAAVKDVDEHLRIADEHYQQAISGLETIVAGGQAALDPAVAATLQKNLGIIDQAIRESREAIQSQPTSQLAQTSLFDALRQKVALLEDTIALINVMRKGDQAGAAKILGGLSKS